MKTSFLIVTDAPNISINRLKQLSKGRELLALDGAYHQLQKANITPDIVLGDFDSLDMDAITVLEKEGIKTIHAPDQNLTDLEKAIIYLDEQDANDITILTNNNGRTDHVLFQYRVLKKYHQAARPLTLFTSLEKIRFLKNETVAITGEIDDKIALLAFPEATVTSNGFAYDLQEYQLRFAEQESVCNSLFKTKASIIISGEALLIHGEIFDRRPPSNVNTSDGK